MNILHVVLRLTHIIAAFAWVGLGLTMTFYIAPAAARAGESGLRFLKSLFSTTTFGSIFAAVAGVTVLAGLLMYIFTDSASYFTTAGNISLGTGALAGILAAVHGGMSTGRATKALAAALQQHVPDGNQPIAASALPQLRELSDKLLQHSQISLVLMIIALIGMGAARYL